MPVIEHPYIFYDGFCGLCDRVVQFVIRHDKKKIFRFASLQSDFARKILGEKISFDSFIYFENGKIYDRSTGALRMFKKLGGFWSLIYFFIFVPTFVRDAGYNRIAKNRYQWFGKFDECKIPKPEQKELFIS